MNITITFGYPFNEYLGKKNFEVVLDNDTAKVKEILNHVISLYPNFEKKITEKGFLINHKFNALIVLNDVILNDEISQSTTDVYNGDELKVFQFFAGG